MTDEVGRQQKIYNDALGRTAKTEVLNWDSTVYSTTMNTYNARDQVTSVRQYQGSDISGVYQNTTMSYDGYGRLQTKQVPEQNPGTATVYAYNPDDTIYSVTDARGASATYTYNNRHLATGISYYSPAGVASTPNVSFTYDAVGNRTSMTDGMGSQSYSYDQVSRMTSETRSFTGVGTFTLNYQYNLAGQLTSLTDPFNAQVGYNYDATGRTTSVTGSGYANVSTYAANFQYRAWGAAKHVDYGNTKTLDVNYNARLQATSFNIPGVISKTYDYHADGRLRFSGDLLDHRFDRSYSYDQATRISEALSGAEARGEPSTSNRPYNQAYQYDAWDHLVGRGSNSLWPPFGDSSGRLWSGPGSSFTPNPQAYVNDRNQSWQYDAGGHLTDSGEVQYTVDAMGAVTHSVSARDDLLKSFSGDGQSGKKVETVTIDDEGTPFTTTSTVYFVRSSVLGKVISEVDQNGQKRRGYVYAGGQVLAQQEQLGATQSVKWEHRDASNASYRRTDTSGAVDAAQMAELDPLGNNAGLSNPYVLPRSPAKLWFGASYPSFGDNSGSGGTQCLVDSIERPCSEAMHMVMVNIGNITVARIAGDVPGTVPTFVPVRVDDPDTHEPTPDLPDVVTTREHYHYEFIPAGMLTNSIQQRQPQNPRVTEQPLTKDQQGIVDDIVKRALRLLDSNQACSDYIRGGSPNSPFTDLAQIGANHRFSYFDGYEGDFVARAPEREFWGLGPDRMILFKNFFKSDVGGDTSIPGVDATMARIETVLHELRHVTTRKGHPTDNASDPDSSYDYDKNIYEKCFGIKLPTPLGIP